MRLIRLALSCFALLPLACDNGSSGRGDGDGDERTVLPPGDGSSHQVPGPFVPGSPGSTTDTRPAVSAEKAPPMISGGTLMVARDGFTAVVADPDRDRVSFVDLRDATVLGHVALEPGDEPGRLAEDASGRVHVALRGSDSLASIDIASRAVIARRHACVAPRGVAYDAATDVLHVACASGRLVSLLSAGGDVLRSLELGPDLRDVVVQGSRLLVSQFKSAALLEVDASGAVMGEYQPLAVTQNVALGADVFIGPQPRAFAPALARRTLAMRGDRALILHERAMSDEVDIGDPHDPEGGPVPDSGLGTGGGYGSGDSCQSIVQTAVSVVDADGNVLQSSSLAGSVLAVDAAISPDGTLIAIANAGLRDPSAPQQGFGPGFIGPIMGAPLPPELLGRVPGVGQVGGSVSLINTAQSTFHEGSELGDGCVFDSMPVPGQPTAVAYTADGTLVVQSREPAALFMISADNPKTISLGGESRLDTGHELFHRDAGGGIACASCHGEGGDDGHVWHFSGLGPRRTQAVNIGLGGTEPFHWSGDMQDLPTLMAEVFVSRMGGVPQSGERVSAFSDWLFAQRPPATVRAADDPAAIRGKALFESEGVGCASCHNGDKFTNNESVDVGTGEPFQVPSLLGVAYRAPFIHTGCARTLRDRFDPDCGGDKHGDVSQLSETELDDLVAYLESI